MQTNRSWACANQSLLGMCKPIAPGNVQTLLGMCKPIAPGYVQTNRSLACANQSLLGMCKPIAPGHVQTNRSWACANQSLLGMCKPIAPWHVQTNRSLACANQSLLGMYRQKISPFFPRPMFTPTSYSRGSYRIYSLGGGGELKMFGIYVMGVHKQAPSRGVWGLPPRFFFVQNRCSQIDSDTVASCHRIYTIIIRKANHRAHGQNILDYT